MTQRLARILRALAVDAALLRRRRELRLLVFGQATSMLGSMITLVAIPVQVYELTGTAMAPAGAQWLRSSGQHGNGRRGWGCRRRRDRNADPGRSESSPRAGRSGI